MLLPNKNWKSSCHGFRENEKIVVGDYAWFLKNHALDWAETYWNCLTIILLSTNFHKYPVYHLGDIAISISAIFHKNANEIDELQEYMRVLWKEKKLYEYCEVHEIDEIAWPHAHSSDNRGGEKCIVQFVSMEEL